MAVLRRLRLGCAAVVLLAAPVTGACGTRVAQPGATPSAPTTLASAADPSAGPALEIEERLVELADVVTDGRDETDVPGLAGVALDTEHSALDVWWVGEPPARVRHVVSTPGAGLAVRLHPATYDVAAMVEAVEKVADAHGVIHAASPTGDGSGIEVETTPRGARKLPDADRLAEEAGMPVRIILSGPPVAA